MLLISLIGITTLMLAVSACFMWRARNDGACPEVQTLNLARPYDSYLLAKEVAPKFAQYLAVGERLAARLHVEKWSDAYDQFMQDDEFNRQFTEMLAVLEPLKMQVSERSAVWTIVHRLVRPPMESYGWFLAAPILIGR